MIGINLQFMVAVQVWGVEPLTVREGGTLPITAFLMHELGAPAIHVPLGLIRELIVVSSKYYVVITYHQRINCDGVRAGQSSDSAHLPNERIRMENLWKGKVLYPAFACKTSN